MTSGITTVFDVRSFLAQRIRGMECTEKSCALHSAIALAWLDMHPTCGCPVQRFGVFWEPVAGLARIMYQLFRPAVKM